MALGVNASGHFGDATPLNPSRITQLNLVPAERAAEKRGKFAPASRRRGRLRNRVHAARDNESAFVFDYGAANRTNDISLSRRSAAKPDARNAR